jgi:hypothetical protein
MGAHALRGRPQRRFRATTVADREVHSQDLVQRPFTGRALSGLLAQILETIGMAAALHLPNPTSRGCVLRRCRTVISAFGFARNAYGGIQSKHGTLHADCGDHAA